MAFSAGFDFFAGRFFRVVFCWVAMMWDQIPRAKRGSRSFDSQNIPLICVFSNGFKDAR